MRTLKYDIMTQQIAAIGSPDEKLGPDAVDVNDFFNFYGDIVAGGAQ